MSAIHRERIGFLQYFCLTAVTFGIYHMWYQVNTTETQIELLQELALQTQQQK